MDSAQRSQLISDRRFDELLQLQVAEVQSAPEDPELRRQMAWVLAAMGRLPEAVKEQREACRLRPDDARYQQTLAGYEAQLAPEPSAQASPELADVFRRIHAGPGSSLTATATVRAVLPALIRGFGIASMLDAPCGDFGWMSTVELGVERYIGIDVVAEVVDAARDRAGGDKSEGKEFRLADITQDQLPRVDLVFCRDCLVHLSEQSTFAAIANFKASGSRFLLTTTFYATPENTRGSTGGWRPINLQRPPFSFGAPEVLVPERQFDPDRPHSDKSLGLWEIAELRSGPAE